MPIPLINDNLLEEMETFTLSLISRIGDTAISDEFNGTDITIVDDDGTCIVYTCVYIIIHVHACTHCCVSACCVKLNVENNANFS